MHWLTEALLVVSGIVALIYGCPYAFRLVQVYRLRQRCREARAIVLTYDDGPSNSLTPRLLELLGKRKVRATFFMLGCRASEYPEIVDSVWAAGHEVGFHAYDHLNAWKAAPWRVYQDIAKGCIAGRAFNPIKIFRPPYGKLTLFSLVQLYLSGLRIGWWTVDSSDSWDIPVDSNEVVKQILRDGGGVVLMHDFGRPFAPGEEERVLGLTAQLIDLAETRGFEIRPIGRVI